MSKEDILDICKEYYTKSGRLSVEKVDTVIKEYCIEKGKKEEDANLLINVLDNLLSNIFSINGLSKSDCFITALEYFENKYEINKITTLKDNNIIHIF